MAAITRASMHVPAQPAARELVATPATAGADRPVAGEARAGIGAGTVAASLAVGGAGLAASLGGAAVGARAGAAGLGRGLGIAFGVAALAGAGYLLVRGAGNGSTEYMVSFREQPDLSDVAPEDVYATLRDHHERNAPPVERELTLLQQEEKVRAFSGIVGANGFVVDVVDRHRDEVEARLSAVQEVGGVAAAPLS